MNWLKKYYEKALLAGSLLILFLVAVYLAVTINSLNDEILATLEQAPPSAKLVPLVDLTSQSNALAALENPAQWTNTDADKIFPPMPIKAAIISPTNLPVEVRPQIALESIVHRPFTLQFKAYVLDSNDPEKRTGHTFQINLLSEDHCFFVEKNGMEIADQFVHTGYFITTFERKINKVFNPKTNHMDEIDRSELTVKHEGEDPIVLTYREVAKHPKRYANIRCLDKSVQVSKAESFVVGEKTYKVVDITDKAVIIRDANSGETQTLSR